MNLPELGQAVGWFGGCVYLLSRAETAFKAWANRRKLDRMIAEAGPLPYEKHLPPPEPLRPHRLEHLCVGCGARVVVASFNDAHCSAPWPEGEVYPALRAPVVASGRAGPAPPLSRMRPPK